MQSSGHTPHEAQLLGASNAKQQQPAETSADVQIAARSSLGGP